MADTILEVKNLKKYFKTARGTLHAVDDVSFTIERGKTLGIVGESGSGKSTIGKAILRYHKPTGGEIFYEGTEIGAMGEKELLPYRKKMQSVFQDPYSSLDPSHTVQDIICEPMEIHKMYTPKERKDRAKELIRVVGLKEQDLLKYPHEFSGGQRQRVWIALALAQQTDILLLDEPTTYLDIAYQVEILDLLMELNKKRGTTILMVLHDINLSARYADHIFAMSKGKLIAQGSPSEVISRELMKQIYGLDCQIIEDPVSGTPLIVPEGRHHRQENTSAKKDTVEEKTEKEQIEASIKTESICA